MQHALNQSSEEHAEIMLQLRDSMQKPWPRDDVVGILELACKDTDTSFMQVLLDEGLDPNLNKGQRPILQRASWVIGTLRS